MLATLNIQQSYFSSNVDTNKNTWFLFIITALNHIWLKQHHVNHFETLDIHSWLLWPYPSLKTPIALSYGYDSLPASSKSLLELWLVKKVSKLSWSCLCFLVLFFGQNTSCYHLIQIIIRFVWKISMTFIALPLFFCTFLRAKHQFLPPNIYRT